MLCGDLLALEQLALVADIPGRGFGGGVVGRRPCPESNSFALRTWCCCCWLSLARAGSSRLLKRRPADGVFRAALVAVHRSARAFRGQLLGSVEVLELPRAEPLPPGCNGRENERAENKDLHPDWPALAAHVGRPRVPGWPWGVPGPLAGRCALCVSTGCALALASPRRNQ